MSDAARRRETAKDLEVLLGETWRDLFRAWWPNLDLESRETLGKLLHAVARPEITLRVITAEGRDAGLLLGALLRPPILPPT